MAHKSVHIYAHQPDEEKDDDDYKGIWHKGPNVYFYADVTQKSTAMLMQAMAECCFEQREEGIEDSDMEIMLHINSAGGDIFSALAVADTLISYPISITTYLEGFVGSSAVLMALGGSKRAIMRNTTVLVHPIRGDLSGRLPEILQEAEMLAKLTSRIAKFYENRTGTPEDAWMKLLSGETWLTADEAVGLNIAFGLVM